MQKGSDIMSMSTTNRNTNQAAINSINKFNGFQSNVYRDNFVNGFAFIFVTKPLLFINPIRPVATEKLKYLSYMNMTRDPKFVPYLNSESLNDIDKTLPKMLSYDTSLFGSSFIPVFTNEFKSFDASDLSMEQTEAFSTNEGFKEILPTFKTSSEAGGSVVIPVSEDGNLTFTKMMTLWVNYISNITSGVFDANPDMIANGTLDYTCSIYYFVLEPDGKTLRYWSKYTGCWPTTIPYSSLRYSKGTTDVVDDINITFAYNVKEDMDPNILEDFNRVSLKLGSAKLIENINGLYRSFNTSSLLNKSKMIETFPQVVQLLDSPERDPIVLFKEASDKSINPDFTQNKYELVFDNYGYKSTIIEDLIGGSNYYTNMKANNNAFTNVSESFSD